MDLTDYPTMLGKVQIVYRRHLSGWACDQPDERRRVHTHTAGLLHTNGHCVSLAVRRGHVCHSATGGSMRAMRGRLLLYLLPGQRGRDELQGVRARGVLHRGSGGGAAVQGGPLRQFHKSDERREVHTDCAWPLRTLRGRPSRRSCLQHTAVEYGPIPTTYQNVIYI